MQIIIMESTAQPLTKTLQHLYFARMAHTVGRNEQALAFLEDHLTQGFKRDQHGQLHKLFQTQDQQPGVIYFDIDELEVTVDIVKEYAEKERKALKKLSVVIDRLDQKGKSESFKNRVTQNYYSEIEDKLQKRLLNLLIIIDNVLLVQVEEKIKHLEKERNRLESERQERRLKKIVAIQEGTYRLDLDPQVNIESDIPQTTLEQQRLEQVYITEKVMCLRLKADLYRYLCDHTEGFYRKEVKDQGLTFYQEASGLCCQLPPSQPLVLKVALSHSTFYYQIMNSVEFAMRILGEAAFEASEEWPQRRKTASEREAQEFEAIQKVIQHNIGKLKKELLEGDPDKL